MANKALENLKARIYKEELKHKAIPKSRVIEERAKKIAGLAERRKKEKGL